MINGFLGSHFEDAELLYIKFTSKDQTLILTQVLTVNFYFTRIVLRFYKDFNRNMGLPKTSWDLLGPRRTS